MLEPPTQSIACPASADPVDRVSRLDQRLVDAEVCEAARRAAAEHEPECRAIEDPREPCEIRSDAVAQVQVEIRVAVLEPRCGAAQRVRAAAMHQQQRLRGYRTVRRVEQR